MPPIRSLFTFLLLASAWLAPISAPAQDFDPFAKRQPTRAELISEQATIAPGKPFTIAIKLTHPVGWHSYYVNPGYVGLILEPKWSLPEGFSIARVAWPVPHTGTTGGARTFGYEGTVYHLFTVTPSKGLASGSPVTIGASPSWQICDEENCVLEPPIGQSINLQVVVATAETSTANPGVADEFQAARAMLPKSLPAGLEIAVNRGPTTATIHLSPASAVPDGKIFFFDANRQLDGQGKQVVERSESAVTVTIPLAKSEDKEEAKVLAAMENLAGVLAIGEAGYAVDATFAVAPPEPVSFGKLLTIFGGMFLGGLILNLMPCVFPVIGIKIMGFVEQAGQDRRKIINHGLAFVAGVLVSFWVLAGLLLAGGIKNWGSQLENPWVVLVILLVLLVLAMAMYGVFELGAGATGFGARLMRKDGLSGSFFSGLLATVVATPCAGPFLGPAIGATLRLPGPLFMLAFTIMALGLGLPYLILSVFPKLVERLPRPGAWMESFKQAMSFLLFGSVGYLLWVYSGQVFEQSDGQKGLYVMVGLSIFAMGIWIYGRWNTPIRSGRVRLIAKVAAALALVGGFALAMPSKTQNLWEPWTLAKQEALIEAGTPVYVDFTARWCATCQTNKAAAYTENIKERFKEHGVVLLKADKTKPSDEIDAELRRLGAGAIPVNVLYKPGDGTPIRTNTVLTAGYMADFLQEHLGESPGEEE